MPGILCSASAILAWGRVDDAIVQFKMVCSLDAETEKGHLRWGSPIATRVISKSSVKELEAVIRIKPDWSTGYFQLGETLLVMGRHDQAIERFEQAKKLSPNPEFVDVRMANVFLAKGDTGKAVAIYEQLIQSGKVVRKPSNSLEPRIRRAGNTTRPRPSSASCAKNIRMMPTPIMFSDCFTDSPGNMMNHSLNCSGRPRWIPRIRGSSGRSAWLAFAKETWPERFRRQKSSSR